MKLIVIFTIITYLTNCNGWALNSGVHTAASKSVFIMPDNKKITWNEINKTLSFVKNVYRSLSTREQILGYAEIEMKTDTPSHGLFLDNYPEPEAMAMLKPTLEAVAASANIAYNYCSEMNEECRKDLMQIKLWNSQLGEAACGRLGKLCSKEQLYSKYRSIDGSCNYYTEGEFGQSFTVYERLLPPNYLDGVREIRRSVTKEALPSPRLVSSNLEIKGLTERRRSLAVLFWGMFLEHDLSHTAISKMIHTEKPIECCDPEGRPFLPRYQHPFCMPIQVPSRDPYYREKDVTCLSYVRSIPALGPDCILGPMNQINQATHFLDGSQIYGTTRSRNDQLRNFTKGFLLSSNANELPLSNNPKIDCQQISCDSCYKSGDKRVNSDPSLTALYTIWMREHNRIAGELSKINPSWNDEEVFQEARRIVIAEMQHITYKEWIPTVLGTKIDKDYNPNSKPTISNEFATAAIRSLQSVLIEGLSLKDEEKILNNEHKSFDDLLKEMVTQKYKGKRLHYMGKSTEATYSYDILSVDVQRGRDHGLATYSEYRKFCGLSEMKNFEDLESIMSIEAVSSLKKSYKRIEDIDLIIGGLAEKPLEGLFGPTISCILKEQFERIKSSDRFFYTNGQQPVPFSDSQLKEIEKVTFSRIICDNTDTIEKVQERVFEIVNESNHEKSCASMIPKMNLRLWSDERFMYTQVF